MATDRPPQHHPLGSLSLGDETSEDAQLLLQQLGDSLHHPHQDEESFFSPGLHYRNGPEQPLPTTAESPIARLRFIDSEGQHQQLTISSTWNDPELVREFVAAYAWRTGPDGNLKATKVPRPILYRRGFRLTGFDLLGTVAIDL